MNDDVGAAKKFYQNHIKGQDPSQETKREFEVLLRRAWISCDAFRAAKNYVSNVGADTIADYGACGIGLLVQFSTGNILLAAVTLVLVSGIGRNCP